MNQVLYSYSLDSLDSRVRLVYCFYAICVLANYYRLYDE